MRNPFRDYPRNLACPCGTGKKFKKCCYLKQALAVIDTPKARAVEQMVRALKRR